MHERSQRSKVTPPAGLASQATQNSCLGRIETHGFPLDPGTDVLLGSKSSLVALSIADGARTGASERLGNPEAGTSPRPIPHVYLIDIVP